jgi:hypothetical protein
MKKQKGEMMMEDLKKVQEELLIKSEQYDLEKKKKAEELMQKRENLIYSFIRNQEEKEYRQITKITYKFSGNAVEDYTVISIFEKDKLLAVSSNLLGIEYLDGFPKHLAERFFEFAFSNYMELLDVEHNTTFEINFQ